MVKLISALLLLPMLGGCASVFGGGGSGAPDEFAVARNAPLIIPPDYTLAPPVAGTAVLNPADAQQQALEALFGGPAPRSASETSLLEQAGRDQAAAGARSTVADPNTRIVDKGNVTATILSTAAGDSSVATTQVR